MSTIVEARQAPPKTDEVKYSTQPYGDGTAQVGYRIVAGCIEVLTAEISCLEFEGDAFERRQTATWRRAIERELGLVRVAA